MDLFFARQPIFDKNKNVTAYELLYRNNGHENIYNGIDGDKSTLTVISNSIYSLELETISDNKRVFINFTENLIKEGIATILPAKDVVIEILEIVEPTKDVLASCKKLKDNGFTLALDDFVFDEKFTELIKLADIIKVDFRITKGKDREKIFETLKINKNIIFLAEKVETLEEYKEAANLGYKYFQGYFFSKPIIISAKAIPTDKVNAVKILELTTKEDIDFEKIELLILKDVGLTYKIMKLINSSLYSFENKINSVKYAIALLGEKEIIKWLHVVLLNNLNGGNYREMVNISLMRAIFCENICNLTEDKKMVSFSYVTGLFSVMDTILNCSMEVITKEIFLPYEVKAALNGWEDNILKMILDLVVNYEKGEWNVVIYLSDKLNIESGMIADAYYNSVKWIKKVKY
ncbi:MAG: HDOD domain-containing protein [Bacillota bacterium]|nr:HDOD domain-containing protein [Bacillota bacterium]